MLDSADLQQIDRAFVSLRVIWIATIVSLGAYVLIANLIDHAFGMMPMFAGTDDPAVAKYGYGLYGIAVAELVVVYFFRRGFTRPKSTKSRLSDGPYSFIGSSGEGPGIGSVQEAIGMYKNGTILCVGLSGAIALSGFMGFIIRTDYVQLYLLIAVSLAALVYVRPKREEMKALAERLEQERRSP